MMKSVVWLGPESILPDHGVVKTGERKELPAETADKYIAQGEAREDVPEQPVIAPRPKKSTEEN